MPTFEELPGGDRQQDTVTCAILRVSKGVNGVEREVANQAIREGFLEVVTIPLK